MAETVHDSNHPLDQIARLFNQIEQSSDSSSGDSNTSNPGEDEQDASTHYQEPPVLTPKEKRFPAFLLDTGLRVAWQNQPAAVHLWQQTHAPEDRPTSRHIFELLLDPDFQQQVDNWQQWLSFFIHQALQMVNKDVIYQHIKLRDKSQQDILLALIDQIDPQEAQPRQLDLVTSKGDFTSYHISVTEFREGRYYTFRQSVAKGLTRRLAAQRIDIGQRLEHLNLKDDPVQIVFYILAARLDNADILQTELLPEEYSRLSNTLMNRFITVIEAYGGIFEQQAGTGLVAYFLPTHQSDTPVSVIDCALEIKSQMSDISREWKIRKGWLHDIELNMAMHLGDEYVGLLPTQLGSALLTHGSALSACTQLCRLATAGQIWSTKDLVGRLGTSEINKLRFGIYRKNNHRKVLVGKSFSRLSDLPDFDLKQIPGDPRFGAMAVTMIFDRQNR